MKKRLIELLQGVLFGMSCMIPGFSGGTMLVILGIYEKFTDSVGKLSKKPLKALGELWAYIIGALVGLGLAAITIVECLNHFPIITSGFFVGLVVATLPLIIRNIKKAKTTIGSIITFIGFCAIAIVLAFSEELGLAIDTDFTVPKVSSIIYIILVSTLGSATMIIPAASGMTVLLVFGVHAPLMSKLGSMINGIFKGNFLPFKENLWFMLPFIVGIFIGTIGISRVISKLLEKHASLVWYAILALIIVSPITIYKDAYQKRILPNPDILNSIQNHLVLNIILSIVFAIIGFVLLYYFYNYQRKKELEKSSEPEVEDSNDDVA